MSSLKIYNDSCADATVISNRFIDEYMKDANDAQLKVYLYLVRMMSANRATSVSDIADQFNHTEKDVLRALKYWEKLKLLALEYNEGRTQLTGIHVKSISPASGSQPVIQAEKDTSFLISPKDYKEDPYEKPSYSLDQMKTFKNSEDASTILFVAEQYLGKPLSPNEIKTIYFFYDKLKFSTDLIDYLIQYCLERGKKDFRYMETVAVSWAEQNITTPRQAASMAKKYDKTVYVIMKTLGKTNTPTSKEVEFVTRWTGSFHFTMDIITEACDRTVLATDSHRFEYADSILASWFRAGVHTKADIDKCDRQFQKTKNAASSQESAGNKFNQFPQNTYDFDQLEKELVSN